MDLIDRAGAGVYADFHFYYRLDLFDLVRKLEDGSLTPAHVLSLIERLPQGNATQAMLNTEDGNDADWRDFFDWSVTDQVLSDIYNAINANSNITRVAKKPIKFEPYPTPGAALLKRKKEAKSKTLDGVYALLSGLAAADGS